MHVSCERTCTLYTTKILYVIQQFQTCDDVKLWLYIQQFLLYTNSVLQVINSLQKWNEGSTSEVTDVVGQKFMRQESRLSEFCLKLFISYVKFGTGIHCRVNTNGVHNSRLEGTFKGAPWFVLIPNIRMNNPGGFDGQGVWYIWGTREIHMGLRWRNMKERNHFKEVGIDGTVLK